VIDTQTWREYCAHVKHVNAAKAGRHNAEAKKVHAKLKAALADIEQRRVERNLRYQAEMRAYQALSWWQKRSTPEPSAEPVALLDPLRDEEWVAHNEHLEGLLKLMYRPVAPTVEGCLNWLVEKEGK